MAVNFKLPAIPYDQTLAGQGGLISGIWNQFLRFVLDRVQRTLWQVADVSLAAQGASIGNTALSPLLPAGLYRIEYYMRVTQPATVSSSATFTVNWTDGAVPQSYSWAALTGNTTTSAQSAATLLHADAGSQVTYATTYSSSGATAMQYALTVVFYRVGEL